MVYVCTHRLNLLCILSYTQIKLLGMEHNFDMVSCTVALYTLLLANASQVLLTHCLYYLRYS